MTEHTEENKILDGYNYKKAVIGLVVILILALAIPFVIPIDSSEPVNPEVYSDNTVDVSDLIKDWRERGINCAPRHEVDWAHDGSFQLLIISKDGINEKIPAHIGVFSDCIVEVYTKDTSKRVYFRSDDGDPLTLNDFFAVWNKELERSGQKIQARVNGQGVSDVKGVVLEDGQEILLEYQNN